MEKKMATRSSIPARIIPWTEKPSRLQSVGLQRFGHDLATEQQQSHVRFTAFILPEKSSERKKNELSKTISLSGGGKGRGMNWQDNGQETAGKTLKQVRRLVQGGRVEGHPSSCDSTEITTNWWTTINRKTLEPTKNRYRTSKDKGEATMRW